MHAMDEARTVTAADVKAMAAALGFDLCGIAPAAAFPELQFLREWLDRGYAGEMHYMHRTAERRADVQRGDALGPIGDLPRRRVQRGPPVFHRERGPGRRRDRAVRLGRRLSRRDRRAPVRARRDAPRRGGRLVRGPRLRRHRAGAGAGVRAVRGARLDRQEHVPDQPGARLMDLPGRDRHQPRARARRARARSVRDVHAVSRGVSDGRAGRAARARLHALPVVSHDRAQGGDPGRAPRRRRRSTRTDATSARRCARGTSRRPRASRRSGHGSRATGSTARRCSICGADRTTSCGRC